jgi:hypothetical protein
VAVDVEGDADAGVTQPLLNHLRMYACLQAPGSPTCVGGRAADLREPARAACLVNVRENRSGASGPPSGGRTPGRGP